VSWPSINNIRTQTSLGQQVSHLAELIMPVMQPLYFLHVNTGRQLRWNRNPLDHVISCIHNQMAWQRVVWGIRMAALWANAQLLTQSILNYELAPWLRWQVRRLSPKPSETHLVGKWGMELSERSHKWPTDRTRTQVSWSPDVLISWHLGCGLWDISGGCHAWPSDKPQKALTLTLSIICQLNAHATHRKCC